MRSDVDYGCLMVNVDIPMWEDILKMVDEVDVYNKPSFGLEHVPHCTVLFGFHIESTNVQKLKEVLRVFNSKNQIDLSISNTSLFQNDEFDVLKFDVKSKYFVDLNKLIRNTFEYTSDYDDFKPHITISYLNKGDNEKYIKTFKTKKIYATEFIYSTRKTKIKL